MEVLIPLLVFLTVLTVAMVMVHRHEHLTREQMLLSRIAAPSIDELTDVDIRRAVRTQESALFANLLAKVRLIHLLESNLWQAGIYMRASDVVALMIVLAIAGGAAAALWSGGAISVAALAGVGAALIPPLYIVWRKRRRLKAFDLQLPEILDMLRSSLNAGHTLQRALQVAVEEFGEPASGELRIVLEQTRIGVSLARALELMLERVPDENLRFLVVAVKIQTDVGSSLSGIIDQLAKTIRDRQRVAMKIRMLTAQPRLGAMIGGLMPVILILALSFIHRETVTMLFHDPAGLMLTKVAAGLELLALVTISRIIRVDY